MESIAAQVTGMVSPVIVRPRLGNKGGVVCVYDRGVDSALRKWHTMFR